MQRIDSWQQYLDLKAEAKARGLTLSNLYFLPGQARQKIDAGRLYCRRDLAGAGWLLLEENGGFYGRVTLDMKIDNTEPRGLTLTGRMLYAFSTAYRVFGDELYREKAAYTFRYLMDHFYDKEQGGAYITLSP